MNEIELKVGVKIRCNSLSITSKPIYEIIELTNDPYYKLPNVKVKDRNGKEILVTDFDII